MLFFNGKGYQKSKLLSARQWKKVPDQITVRILRFDAVIRRRKKTDHAGDHLAGSGRLSGP
jgi:hypothetical protein